jgi:branched-chain amino acid transport system substrate-binding protein
MKNMKKLWAVIVVVVVIVLIWSISVNRPTSPDKVVFGALAPLTGQISVLGEHMRNGMEIAKQEVIDSGKIKDFSINYQDACDGKSSLNAVNKLINIDKVKVISSSFCLFGEDVVVPNTEEAKVIFFNTAANPESVLNKKYVFSTNFTIRNDSEKMAEFVANTLNAKTVAIVHLDTSFGESYRDNFTKFFTDKGGKVVITEKAAPDKLDFRTEMTKIKAINPDVVMIIHFGSSLGNAIKQARELGIESKLIGDYESEDPTILKIAGNTAEGYIFSSSEPATPTQKVIDFQNKYKQKFGELPDVLAANGYDAIHLQVDAYVACKGDTDCMANRLESIKDYDGVSGSITIDPKDHSVTKPNIFKIVKNGQFVEYK